MKTDRELLELAAKAAGIGGGWGEVAMIGNDAVDLTDIWFLEDPEYCAIWNPLTDDGDALRLAVRLGLQVHTSEDSYVFAGIAITETGLGFCECRDDDPCAATRRAIVRAAAAIGESMND